MQIEDPPLAGTSAIRWIETLILISIASLGQRAQTILAPILLRRTKNSQLEGEPILKLPAKTIDITLTFTDDERDVSFLLRCLVELELIW